MIADPLFIGMTQASEKEGAPEAKHDENEDYSPLAHTHDHDDHGLDHSHASTSGPSSEPQDKDAAQDKVRSTLRSFVRDWSEEGRNERQACYGPCLEALERHYPQDTNSQICGRKRGDIKVLVPGCGLGRLALEIASRGARALVYHPPPMYRSF